MTPSSSRVLFVDLARALAVLFMIQGHTLNVLLAPEYSSGPVFDSWLFLRGLTSRLFLLLAGFAFTVATSRHWDENRRVSTRTLRRVGRFLFFILLGYSMRFPVAHLRDLAFLRPEHWRYFLTVDILQCIGAGLLLLQLLVFVARTRTRFIAATAGLCLVVVAATPLAAGIDGTGTVPVGLAAYLSTATGSLFPFLPWGGYLLLGAALGGLYAGWGARRLPAFTKGVMAAGGAAAIVLGLALELLHVGPFARAGFWSTSPYLFLVTAGSALVLLAGFALASRRVRRLPPVLQALAEESLIIYFIHIFIVYGSSWNPGLRQLVGGRLDLSGTAVWIAIIITAMAGLAWVWHRVKHDYPQATRLVKLTAAACVIYSLA